MRIYRQHLQEQAEEERRREKELDTVVSVEVEKQWEKKMDHWQREAEARQKLLHDVLDIRKEQVQDKCQYKIYYNRVEHTVCLIL